MSDYCHCHCGCPVCAGSCESCAELFRRGRLYPGRFDYAALVRAMAAATDPQERNILFHDALKEIEPFEFRAEREYFLRAFFNHARRTSGEIYEWVVDRWFPHVRSGVDLPLDPAATADLPLPNLYILPLEPVDLVEVLRRARAG